MGDVDPVLVSSVSNRVKTVVTIYWLDGRYLDAVVTILLGVVTGCCQADGFNPTAALAKHFIAVGVVPDLQADLEGHPLLVFGSLTH